MRYLSAKEIIVINALVIELGGGVKGVRDVNILISLLERPKTSFSERDQFPVVFDKAAAYTESLARYYVFMDGNKRTALAASARFLAINNYQLTAGNEEVESFILRVATGQESISRIALWWKKNTKKIK